MNVILTILCAVSGYYLISALQWYAYRLERLILHFTRPLWHFYFAVLPSAAAAVALGLGSAAAGAVAAAGFAAWLFWWQRGLDKPLVFTARVWRYFGILALVLAATNAAIYVSGDGDSPILWLLLPIIPPLFASVLSGFVEQIIAKFYLKKAQNRVLNSPDLTIILITASFGKTSIKHYLAHFLEGSFAVQYSPRSVNTLNGLARDINDNLSQNTQFYIAEAGARQMNDIAEITALLAPQIVVVGQIGAAHLEYFKTTERTKEAKTKALKSTRLKAAFLHSTASSRATLPDAAAAPADAISATPSAATSAATSTAALVSAATVPAATTDAAPSATPVAAASKSGQIEPIIYDDLISNVTADLDGVSFDLVLGGENRRISAPLLGAFNAQNIGAAALVASSVGVGIEAIIARAATLKPAAHRLQRLDASGKIIIDDSFNGNLAGMSESYRLAALHNGRKILLTPGVVEAGEVPNRELSVLIDEVFDILVITHPINARALKSHIRRARVVELSGHGAMEEFLAHNTAAGDLILFSNDAPNVI